MRGSMASERQRPLLGVRQAGHPLYLCETVPNLLRQGVQGSELVNGLLTGTLPGSE